MLTNPSIEAWSKAGCSTCVLARYSKKLSLAFDLGACNTDDVFNCNHVFISHGHLDHCGAAFSHARQRCMTRSPAKYYVPECIQGTFLETKEKMETLNGSTIGMDIVGVRSDTVINLGANLFVRVFPTTHRVPSVGYVVTKVKTTLKNEFKELTKKDRSIMFKGMCKEEIDKFYTSSETVELVYTGDTLFSGINVIEDLLKKNIRMMIMECTFVGLNGTSDDIAAAHKKSHIHLDEIISNQQLFDSCETLILMHMSNRYGIDSLLSTLNLKLPLKLKRKVIPALDSFGVRQLTHDSYLKAKSSFQAEKSKYTELGESWASCIVWDTSSSILNAILKSGNQSIDLRIIESRWSENSYYRSWLGFYCLEVLTKSESLLDYVGIVVPSAENCESLQNRSLVIQEPLMHNDELIGCDIYLFSHSSKLKKLYEMLLGESSEEDIIYCDDYFRLSNVRINQV